MQQIESQSHVLVFYGQVGIPLSPRVSISEPAIDRQAKKVVASAFTQA
jgi:hypothetical protein